MRNRSAGSASRPARPGLLVAMSGGTTPVIQATLAGIVAEARESGAFGRVLAGVPGISGVLREELVDLSTLDDAALAGLRPDAWLRCHGDDPHRATVRGGARSSRGGLRRTRHRRVREHRRQRHLPAVARDRHSARPSAPGRRRAEDRRQRPRRPGARRALLHAGLPELRPLLDAQAGSAGPGEPRGARPRSSAGRTDLRPRDRLPRRLRARRRSRPRAAALPARPGGRPRPRRRARSDRRAARAPGARDRRALRRLSAGRRRGARCTARSERTDDVRLEPNHRGRSCS